MAHASQERETTDSGNITPYWRTLKKGGELNEKYPGSIDLQKLPPVDTTVGSKNVKVNLVDFPIGIPEQMLSTGWGQV